MPGYPELATGTRETTVENKDHRARCYELCGAGGWCYRIEGGQKMVFCQKAPNIRRPRVLCLYSRTFPLPHISTQPLFARHLSKYIMSTEVIDLLPTTLESLISNAQLHRPSNRPPRYVAHSKGTLHLDAATYFGPEQTILVEIKPKSAVLSVSRLNPVDHAIVLRKYTIPAYHVKNYLAVRGAIPERAYYPCDMLSGNEARMQNAASVLQKERASALRVFSGGSLIDAEPATKAVRAAIAALAHDGNAVQGVRKIQEADILDTWGAFEVMGILIKRLGLTNAESLVTSVTQGETLLEDVDETEVDQARRDIAYSCAEEGAKRHNELERRQAMEKLEMMRDNLLVRLVADFLQAATAKDCSLMVALCQRTDDQMNTHVSNEKSVIVDGVEWLYRVWVVDVGQKDVRKITSRWPNVERRRAATLQSRD